MCIILPCVMNEGNLISLKALIMHYYRMDCILIEMEACRPLMFYIDFFGWIILSWPYWCCGTFAYVYISSWQLAFSYALLILIGQLRFGYLMDSWVLLFHYEFSYVFVTIFLVKHPTCIFCRLFDVLVWGHCETSFFQKKIVKEDKF